MKTSTSRRSSGLDEHLRNFADLRSSDEVSSVLSTPEASMARRSFLTSKPTTWNFLPNSTASGSPTYPSPIRATLISPVLILFNMISCYRLKISIRRHFRGNS